VPPTRAPSSRRLPRGRRLRTGVVLPLAVLAAGCFQYRAHPPNVAPATEVQGEVVWSFAWGLAQEQPNIANCNDQALAEVTVQDNLAFSLLTVVTLGIVSPKRIEWKCAVAPACEGELRPDSTTVPLP